MRDPFPRRRSRGGRTAPPPRTSRGSNPSANVGLVHGMSHALGARHGVAHGMGNAILLPHVMRCNAGRPEGANRLKDVGQTQVLNANISTARRQDAFVAGGAPRSIV